MEQQDVKIINAFWESVTGLSDFRLRQLLWSRLQETLNKTNPKTARFFAHRDRVHNYTKSIKNDYARYLIRSFMTLCPDIPLCYDQGEFYQNYSYFQLGDFEFYNVYGNRQKGLCQVCSCAADCEQRDDCCISKYLPEQSMLLNESDIGEFQFRSTKQLTRFSCLTTRLGEIADKNGVPIPMPKQKYLMVAHCPDDYPKDIVWRKCKRYLPPEQRRQEGLFTPVFSIKTNTTYHNKHCAECFGEVDDDLFPWQKLIVSDAMNENVRVGLDPFLAAYDKKAVIVFIPPRVLHQSFICNEPDISKCNETGMWRTYDERLRLACETLPQKVTNDIQGDGGPRYKNIYCAMCNVVYPEYTLSVNAYQFLAENDSPVDGLYITFYRQTLGLFASLLSFSALDMLSAYSVDNKCRPEEVYSPILVGILM